VPLLAALVHIPANAGYSLVFALIAVETMGIPVPGETALITAALLAHDGEMSIELLIGLAAAAAILGDNIGFAIGRKGGRRLFLAPGPLHDRRVAALELGEPFFAKHGPKAVFLGRWVSGLRIASAWLAGMNKMAWPTFLFWNALGGIAWAITVGLLAYYLGPTAEHIFKVTGIAGVSVALVVAAGYLLWRWRRLRRDAAATP
jgi:membrane protein DedA with SNARE-associated domain